MDEDNLLLLLIVAECLEEDEEEAEERRLCRKRPRIWQKEWLGKKEEYSSQRLLSELKCTEPEDYKNFMRMDEGTFNDLLSRMSDKIHKQDTRMRDAIPPEVRLGITLRFLATGNSFEDMKFSSAVSAQTIGKIVIETCKEIIRALREYIKMPTSSEEWKEIAKNFNEVSHFPHCLGPVDGKHINIKKPAHSGSLYFNYKKHFSIVLLAVVNAKCEFIYVNIGTNGRVSDGGVFLNSTFFWKLQQQQLNLPAPELVFPGSLSLPYVFVADDAFALRENIMKPFAHANLSAEEMCFNTRLSSARVKVENTFGILASRFRVLLTTINLCPEKATTITLACCYLHNFLHRRRDNIYMNFDGNTANCSTNSTSFTPIAATASRNASNEAKEIRRNFCEVINALPK